MEVGIGTDEKENGHTWEGKSRNIERITIDSILTISHRSPVKVWPADRNHKMISTSF